MGPAAARIPAGTRSWRGQLPHSTPEVYRTRGGAVFLTRRMRYFRAPAPPTEISENQNDLIMRLLPRRPSRKSRGEGLFCHYMAQNGLIFPPKSGLGSKFPSLGSANPWDGNRFPWDVSAETPRAAAFPTLKGGQRSLSALTLCHIAHGGRAALQNACARGCTGARRGGAWGAAVQKSGFPFACLAGMA